jgi:hypothetical protein
VRPESKASSKKFPHTHMDVVHSTRDSPDMVTSLHFADKPAEHDQLFPHSYLVGRNFPLQMQPVFTNVFIQLFDRIRGWSILFEVSSELSLDIYHRFRLTELQHRKCFFRLSPNLTSVLYSIGKSWNYFLRKRATF